MPPERPSTRTPPRRTQAPSKSRGPARSHGRPQKGSTTGATIRRNTVRLPREAALQVRGGHPWVYREALGSRPVAFPAGEVVEIVDEFGEWVGRGLYDPDSPMAVRLWTRKANELITPALINQRVREALRVREQFPPDATAYRMINGESDGMPGLAVDRYEDYLVVHVFSGALTSRLPAVFDALKQVISPKGIYLQNRVKSLGGEGPKAGAELVRGEPAPIEFEVREGKLKYWVDVTAPLSTGLFLDLRDGRARVAKWAKGRRVLNLFSYTGALSVAAEAGGAKSITAVDSSAKAHARARKNFALNGFEPEAPELIVGDVLSVLTKFEQRDREFDIVILDPPAFGTGGKGKVFQASKDYVDLVQHALSVLTPDGVLVAISSLGKMDPDEFDRMLSEGASKAGATLRVLERSGLPSDFCVAPGFPEGNYLKVVFAARGDA